MAVRACGLAEELIEMIALAVFVYALLVELAASVGTLHLEPRQVEADSATLMLESGSNRA